MADLIHAGAEIMESQTVVVTGSRATTTGAGFPPTAPAPEAVPGTWLRRH